MKKAGKVSKKQLAVIDELFSGDLDEQAVLDKYNISRAQYCRWLANEDFAEQFDRRIAAAYRQSAALIARYATLAAAKLVQLTESSNPETSRKACLDIITLDSRRSMLDTRSKPADEKPAEHHLQTLSPETAGKILEVLAQEEKQKTEDRKQKTDDK